MKKKKLGTKEVSEKDKEELVARLPKLENFKKKEKKKGRKKRNEKRYRHTNI